MIKTDPLSLLRDALVANHTVAAEDRSLLLPNKSQLSIDTPTGRNQQLTLSLSQPGSSGSAGSTTPRAHCGAL